jgi:hypothetical protein
VKIAILEGKTSTERNKIIAAGVLGVVSLFALYFAFGSSLFGGSATSVTVKTSPTPKPSVTPATSNRGDQVIPSASDQQFFYESTAINYQPGNVYAPEPGRNIFAFYEPPPPCKGLDCPTPTPKPVFIPSPTVAPTPPMRLMAVTPQNVYEGSKGFRIELNGDRFDPQSRIYFNQVEMPTIYVSPQKLMADIPANLIASEGQRQVMAQTPDGKLYSDQQFLYVQPAPKPTFQYIGMIARARGNNDTGVFERQGKPFSQRLNDIVDQQFRLIRLSREEATFEDVNLGFKHRVPVSKSAPVAASAGPARGQDSGFAPFDPGAGVPQNIPGIPNNIQRYVPPPTTQQQQQIEQKAQQQQQQIKADSVDDKGDD